jgi:uncharacterized protein
MATKLVHYEIPADDAGKAKQFWGGLFGWQFEDYPGPVEYPMARVTDEMGVAIATEPGQGGPRAYFDVDDIHDGIARVKELGGEADEAMSVPQMGWFVTCKDTSGNEFGLWQTDESAPTPDM